MSLIFIKSAIQPDIIDRWNITGERITAQSGQTYDPRNDLTILNDKSRRSCLVRHVNFNKHRQFYLDITNNLYPFVDFYHFKFNVQLYRVLEIQHITYFKDDHHAAHVDTVFAHDRELQRKISIVLMLSNKNDYTGGNLVVNGQRIDLDKGDIVMFKPTTTHVVEKVEDGVRKTLASWVLGPQWK